jgi:O-antigen/teichoic acid export membrane protein
MADKVVPESHTAGTLGNIIAKNTVFVTLGNLALKALNFLFTVYVVRSLGDERFGQYSIVLAFVGIFQIFAELGVSQYVRREIARDKSKTEEYVWNLMAIRVILALVGIGTITSVAAAVGYAPELVLGIFIYTFGFLLSAIDMPLDTVLWANERMDYLTLMNVLSQVVFITFGGLFLFAGLNFIWLIVASLLSIIPRIVVSVLAIRKHGLLKMRFPIKPRIWYPLIRSGIPFGLISLALTIDYSVDTLMLERFVSDNEVGWYNVAYRLSLSLIIFFSGFSVAMVPSLSRTYVEDKKAVERWYYRSVKFIILSSLPLAVGGMIVSTPLIQFLFTEEFTPSAMALKIIIWDVPFVMFASFCGNMTTVVAEEKTAARVYIISAVANVVLNLIFIPRFGFLGAAATTVATDLIISIQFYFLLKRKLHLPDIKPVLARVAAASIVMGLMVWWGRDLHLFLQIGLGISVYGMLVFAFRLLEPDEKTMIVNFVMKPIRRFAESR